MNIDEDIERVKELVKNLKEKFKRISGAIAIMPRIEKEDVQAIENVLKELEIKEKMIDLMAQTLLNYGFVLIKSRKGIKEFFRKKAQNE